MELKEGMYVRFEGIINSILEIDDEYIVFDNNWYDHWADEVSSMKIDRFIRDYKPIIKKDVVELIEKGDYVNGKRVTAKIGKYIYLEDEIRVSNKQIKTILTKEQYESMSYKV